MGYLRRFGGSFARPSISNNFLDNLSRMSILIKATGSPHRFVIECLAVFVDGFNRRWMLVFLYDVFIRRLACLRNPLAGVCETLLVAGVADWTE